MKAIAVVLVVAGCGVLLPPGGPPTRAPVLATMSKHGCLAGCPIYDLTFYADGTIEYDGKYNVVATGRRWVHIDPTLLRGALRYDFGIADYGALPARGHLDCYELAIVTFEYAGKRVEHDYGDLHAPEALTQLELDLDRLADTSDLVGIAAVREGPYCYP